MVKLTHAENYDHTNKKITGSLFSDTKAEITDGMAIVGVPSGYKMDFGSDVTTSYGEVAFMQSDGTWNWLGGN